MTTYISRAYPKLIFALFVILFGGGFVFTLAVSAQEESAIAAPESVPAIDQFVCSDFYRENSVTLTVTANGDTAATDNPLTFTGEVENTNSYPIVEGEVWVKIYQVENASDTKKRKRTNLVGYFKAVDDVSIKAFSKTPINFSWTPPTSLVSGDYDATYYFVSSDHFYLSGLPYLDSVEGPYSTFKVKGAVDQTVYFDRTSVKLNNVPYDFSAKNPSVYGREEILYIQANLLNPTIEEKTVELNFKTSVWGGEKGLETVIDKQYVVIKPGSMYAVSHMPLNYGGAVTLVEAEVKDGDSVSLFQTLFERRDLQDAMITFASIDEYPLKAEKSRKIFACVEGISNLGILKLDLSLRLFDKNGQEVFSEKKPVSLMAEPSVMMADFMVNKASGDFSLEATLTSGEVVLDKVVLNYACDAINSGKCKGRFVLPDQKYFLGAIVGVAGLLLLIMYFRHRRKHSNHIIAE